MKVWIFKDESGEIDEIFSSKKKVFAYAANHWELTSFERLTGNCWELKTNENNCCYIESYEVN